MNTQPDLPAREPRYWLGVVSREHVLRGVSQGIAQLNHGKRAPLARMHKGDWLVYYSPRTGYPDGDPLQAFTAIGQILSAVPYQVQMSPDFEPFRHDARYLPCQEVPIQSLLAELSFISDKQHWGAPFRFGHLPLPQEDFLRIAASMGADLTP
jgi:hypothetical protein